MKMFQCLLLSISKLSSSQLKVIVYFHTYLHFESVNNSTRDNGHDSFLSPFLMDQNKETSETMWRKSRYVSGDNCKICHVPLFTYMLAILAINVTSVVISHPINFYRSYFWQLNSLQRGLTSADMAQLLD